MENKKVPRDELLCDVQHMVKCRAAHHRGTLNNAEDTVTAVKHAVCRLCPQLEGKL